MTSREEKNKEIVNEINKEKTIQISKRIIKILFFAIIIFSLIFFYIYYLGPKGLKTHEYIIKDSKIPSGFHGEKILHFTDLLYGETTKENEIQSLKNEIDLINPNIVIFTGNLVHSDYLINEEEIKYLNTFFKNIPYTIGKYAIKGDKDSTTFDLIFEDTDFIILENEIIDIFNDNNQKIQIIGLNTNEFKDVNSENDIYTITLINNYDDYSKYNLTSNLILSGFNLGGEIRLFNIPLLGEGKHLDSFYEENNTQIYISNGIGTINHLRLFNKPSINVYRLYNSNN